MRFCCKILTLTVIHYITYVIAKTLGPCQARRGFDPPIWIHTQIEQIEWAEELSSLREAAAERQSPRVRAHCGSRRMGWAVNECGTDRRRTPGAAARPPRAIEYWGLESSRWSGVIRAHDSCPMEPQVLQNNCTQTIFSMHLWSVCDRHPRKNQNPSGTRNYSYRSLCDGGYYNGSSVISHHPLNTRANCVSSDYSVLYYLCIILLHVQYIQVQYILVLCVL